MKKLANYTHIKLLKKGSTGNISLYFSESDSKKVAIKEIDISDHNKQTINELEKEAELLKSVNHPNIIQFYESFIEDTNLYIVMEYCEKNDLNRYINDFKDKNEKIPEEFIWKVAFQVLDALHYLHNERKIVHKDIKPLNLLIDKDDNIKVCDFGSSGMVSILTKIKTSLRLTDKHYTPVCRPPEEEFKFQSDIWSLGVTLYYMAEMIYPFGEESEKAIKDNILNKIPKEIDEFYTPKLNNFIMKMLIKDYLKRPSAKECIDMIPREIKKKINPNYQIYNNFLIRFRFGPIVPIEIEYKPDKKEKIFYDLYSVVSEFRNNRNFICPKCKKIPKININFIELEASFQCECGYFKLPNIIDFYRIFTEQRNQQRPDICTNCGNQCEQYEELKKDPQKYEKLFYKYCCECKKVLCFKCKKKHAESNPEHSLMPSLVEFNSICISHKKKLSHFCKDCFINLCEECKKAHNNNYIGHNIKENIKIDENMIEEADSNIDTIYKSIKKCEKYILEYKKNNANKFDLLFKLNLVNLFLLYKSNFLEMYKLNPTNYIAINNFLDNNLKIQDIKIYEDKSIGKIYDIFTPLYNKSISGSELFREKNILNDKNGANNELIDLIEIGKSKYLSFSKFGVKIINDIEFFDCGEETILNIDNVYRLKDGRFLISEKNKLKIYRYKEDNLFSFILDFNFPKFCEEKISSFLELKNGKLLVLSEGIITVFKKEGRKNYTIYKNKFHLLEKIYSMIEFDDKTFITISEIKNEERYCHIETWDSETISITFSSPNYFIIPKHQNNMLKVTDDLVIIILDEPDDLNLYPILIFQVKNKIDDIINKGHYNYSRIIKASNGCFIGISKKENIPCLEQTEIIKKDNFLKCSKIGFKEIETNDNDNEDIINVLVSEEKFIVLKKNGKVIIFEY